MKHDGTLEALRKKERAGIAFRPSTGQPRKNVGRTLRRERRTESHRTDFETTRVDMLTRADTKKNVVAGQTWRHYYN